MKKKKRMALAMMLVFVVFAACDDTEASQLAIVGSEQMAVVEESVDSQQNGARPEMAEVEYSYVHTEPDVIMQEVTIYYGNGRADGLDTRQQEVEELTAEFLVDALAGHNIVSIDTKVKAFECVKEQGSTILKLDLSKAFGEYLKTMGENGEEVVMAALTNTFLHNYEAEGLILTVEGQVLETSHHVYEEVLTFENVELHDEEQ